MLFTFLYLFYNEEIIVGDFQRTNHRLEKPYDHTRELKEIENIHKQEQTNRTNPNHSSKSQTIFFSNNANIY